jgi:hypothetical protein
LALLDRLKEVENEREVLKLQAQERAQQRQIESKLESRCAALDAALEAAQEELQEKVFHLLTLTPHVVSCPYVVGIIKH